MSIIIGIIGKKNSGKDTVSDFLVQKYNFKKLSFASKLKDVLLILYPQLEEKHLNDRDLKEKSLSFLPNEKSPRQLMQYFGTEICRSFDKDIWINILKDEINKCSIGQNIVISDIRHQNELDFVTSLNMSSRVIILEISRCNCNYSDLNSTQDFHSTENNILFYKHTKYIENNASKQQLFDQVEKIVN